MPARKAGVGEKGLRKTKGGAVNNANSDEAPVDKPKLPKGPKGGQNMKGAGSDSSVEVEFKDGKRRIDFLMGAIEAIEGNYPDKVTGNPTTPISVILRWQRSGFGMSWSQLKVFLWAGLLWETPDIAQGDLNAMMDIKRIKYYSERVDKALQLSFGISDEDIAAAQEAANEAARKEAAEKNGALIGEN